VDVVTEEVRFVAGWISCVDVVTEEVRFVAGWMMCGCSHRRGEVCSWVDDVWM